MIVSQTMAFEKNSAYIKPKNLRGTLAFFMPAVVKIIFGAWLRKSNWRKENGEMGLSI